jgi:hypothetical protein
MVVVRMVAAEFHTPGRTHENRGLYSECADKCIIQSTKTISGELHVIGGFATHILDHSEKSRASEESVHGGGHISPVMKY